MEAFNFLVCFLGFFLHLCDGSEDAHINGNFIDLSELLLSELHDLRTQYVQLKRQQEKMEREKIQQDEKLNKLSTELRDMREKYDTLKQNGGASGSVSKQRFAVNNSMLTDLRYTRGISEVMPIGFTAKLSSSLSNLGRDQTLIFDSVISNIGNGYNPRTGIFTCNYAGLYIFFSNVLAYPGKRVGTEIVHNGKSMVQLYSANSNYYGNGCNMVVLQLDAGDTVWTRVDGDYHASGTEIDFTWTTFTGVLING